MSIPRVAIVGRPNVGKSSLLNWVAGKRVSVVDPTAGVTRDRVTYLIHQGDRYFELIDTGGVGVVDSDDLSQEIEKQIRIGIDEADLILFVVDGRSGVVPLDRVVADRLRRIETPKLLVINKCDSPKTDNESAEFFGLTDASVVHTSVLGNRNRIQLLDAILTKLRPPELGEQGAGASLLERPELKLAIVGRRNVGKSTFINALSKTERVIVSEIPGTTRDSIDIRFEMDDKRFIAIDTPGVRKRKSIANDIEFYGLVRAKRSIRRADVVLMFFDSQQTVSRVDKQLVDEIAANFKPCIFVVNKWDLAIREGMTTAAWTEYLISTFGMLRHAPIAYLTANQDKNTRKVINVAQSIFKQSRIRISTSQLNKTIRAAILNSQPPYRQNKRPKIYYATQVSTEPTTIVLKCNHPDLFDDSWKRYLLGTLREQLPFREVPIKLYYRAKTRDELMPSLDEIQNTEMIHSG